MLLQQRAWLCIFMVILIVSWLAWGLTPHDETQQIVKLKVFFMYTCLCIVFVMIRAQELASLHILTLYDEILQLETVKK